MKQFLKVFLAILLIAVGLFFLLCGLAVDDRSSSFWIVAVVIGGVSLIVAFILLKTSSRSSSPAKSARKADSATKPRETVKVVTLNRETFKIAGVTFINKDGSSRQQLLKAYEDLEPPFPEYTDYQYELREEEYKGDPALSVWCNGYQFGYVPSDTVPRLIESFRNGNCDITRIDVKTFQPDSGADTIYSATVEVCYF